MNNALSQQPGKKPRVVVGRGFQGEAVKVICLRSLRTKLRQSERNGPANFSATKQGEVLAECQKKIDQGVEYVKVKIISGGANSAFAEANNLLHFELIDDFKIPEKIRMFCKDIFKELDEVGLPAVAHA